ncbi:MAG: hypothetical protein Q8M65_04655, partial [Rhodoglobus sp.]|nr:hypothetical protein [Rhodoglobus sp.]
WAFVRDAMRRDDPRSITDHRSRHAIGRIGWSTLMNMRTDQAVFYGREFERHFNAAPPAPRAQVHVLQPRKVANG